MQGLCFGLGHGHLGLTGSAPTGEGLARAILRDGANLDLGRFAPNALAVSGDTGRRMFQGAKS
jgi:glycine/D-amino acid oxidase-like deaminating enzyme